MEVSPEAALYQTIGMVSITWAHAENALILIIVFITEFCPECIGPDGVPRSLKQRIAFLRRASKAVPMLQVFDEQFVFVAERFGKLKESRHHLVHGLAWAKMGEHFPMHRLVVEGRRTSVRLKLVTIRDAVRVLHEIQTLVDETLALLALVGAHLDGLEGR